jgi:signal transduction histidine kinase
MRDSHPVITKAKIALTLAAAAFAVYAVSLFVGPPPTGRSIIDQFVPIIVPIVAAIICAIQSRRGRRDARAMWSLFALGAASWAAGDVGFTTLDLLGLTPAGTLTIADVGYLGLIVAWFAALLAHPARGGERILGQTIDALTILAIAASLTIEFAIIPIIQNGESLTGTAISLSYPVGDLVLISTLLSLVARLGKLRPATAFISISLASLMLADVLYARLAITDSYVVGLPIDLAWHGAFICIAIASRLELSTASAEPRAHTSNVLIGFLAVPMLILIAMVSDHPGVLLIGAIVVVLLRSARLLVEMRESQMLQRDLERSIEERVAIASTREEFIAAASHQLRTPLTSIRLRLDEVRDLGPGDPVAAEYLDEIDDQIRWLQTMSESLLTLLSGEQQDVRTNVSAAEAVDRVLRRIAAVAEARGIRVNTDVDREALVFASEATFEELIFILVDNAIKYAQRAGAVQVNVLREEDHCVIDVIDDGPGLSDQALTRAFDPFYRGATSQPGFGLGLTIAKRICDAAGASIALTPGADGGTVARVRWPAQVVARAEP